MTNIGHERFQRLLKMGQEWLRKAEAGEELNLTDVEQEKWTEDVKPLGLLDIRSDPDTETKCAIIAYKFGLDEDEDDVNAPPQSDDSPEHQRAADADADVVKDVLEEIFQASKKICYAHNVNVAPEILTKVLDNLKESITQERAQQANEQHERKRKLTSHIPNSADPLNNVAEDITRLPASKKIRYDHDDQQILAKLKISAGGGGGQ